MKPQCITDGGNCCGDNNEKYGSGMTETDARARQVARGHEKKALMMTTNSILYKTMKIQI